MLADFRRYFVEEGKAYNTKESYCLTVKGFCFVVKSPQRSLHDRML